MEEINEGLPRALAIVGPTASGKSRLGSWLAKRLALPVLCCDSVQVYRGLDIGSAKPDAALQARTPHRLVDLVDPDADFSAGDYAAAALAEVGEGPALFAGGTGFYLRGTAWTNSGDGSADADDAARAAFTGSWEAREREASGCVHVALSQADPDTAKKIHPRNVVRALRALWLCEAHSGPVSALRAADPPRPRLALALVVLEPEAVPLDRAIDARCDAMMRAGLVAEVEMLRKAGYDARHKSMRSLGYRQLLDHLAGHLSLADAVAAIKLATRHYARRQRTYFKTQLPCALRIPVTAPLWEPAVDLAEETASWLPGVQRFLFNTGGGAKT